MEILLKNVVLVEVGAACHGNIKLANGKLIVAVGGVRCAIEATHDWKFARVLVCQCMLRLGELKCAGRFPQNFPDIRSNRETSGTFERLIAFVFGE